MQLDQRKSALTVSALFLAVAIFGIARISWHIWNWYGPPGGIIFLGIPTVGALILSAVYWSKSKRVSPTPDNPPLERTGQEDKL
jgi:hypothetical protein